MLKGKIKKAKAHYLKQKKEIPADEILKSENRNETVVSESKRLGRPNPHNLTPCQKLQNITKNYGRAICNFILCDEHCEPYLTNTLCELNVEKRDFLNFIRGNKDGINGIKEFRGLLLVYSHDSNTLASYKKAFQYLSEIFIKYFSVNWIFSGKVIRKFEYLRDRNKMLRRVRNPQYFTYFK